MNTATFIFKNASRNKRRLLLSVLSAAVSLFLLVTLMVVLRELTKPSAELRIMVSRHMAKTFKSWDIDQVLLLPPSRSEEHRSELQSQ